MRYYKTNDPTALAARKQYLADCDQLRAAANAFATRYPGAKPVFKHSAHGLHLYGLRFTPELKDPLWTKASAGTGMIQRPRTSPLKGSKGEERRRQIEQLAELNIAYREHFPQCEADQELVWKALGTDWGSVMFGGMKYFDHDGHLYMRTSAKLADYCVEILGSEYDLALAMHETAKTVATAQQAAA